MTALSPESVAVRAEWTISDLCAAASAALGETPTGPAHQSMILSGSSQAHLRVKPKKLSGGISFECLVDRLAEADRIIAAEAEREKERLLRVEERKTERRMKAALKKLERIELREAA